MLNGLLPLLLLAAVSAQDAPKPPLPNPFTLKKEELAEGNPLAQYVELVKTGPDYLKGVSYSESHNGNPLSNGVASAYAEARATVEANLGDIAGSLRTQTLGWFYSQKPGPVTTSPLDGLKPVSAIGYIVDQADTHPWIMIGEEHMKPQTRTLLVPLLRELRKKGFKTFAAEAFNADVEKTLVKGSPTWDTGFYTQDPVFAEAVREAVKLGYRLVEYEARERPKESHSDDPWFGQNFREHLQAQNLKERVFDRDPRAKVLVWAGRSHVIKVSSKQPDGEFRPMASEFKRMTGIDPLSIYLPTFVEAGFREYEQPEYKYATAMGWVKRPTLFVDAKGEAYGWSEGEVNVFFPRTSYVHGRPDWLSRELGRVARPVPKAMVKGEGPMLAQVWLQGEPIQVVPIDQALILPGEPVPVLMVPKGSDCWMRVIDGAGKELGRAEVQG